MDQHDDHGGNSKSASTTHEEFAPDYADIAARAHQLWLEQGQPPDSAERNWLEAERELRASATSRRLLQQAREHAGSVQP